MHTIDFLEIIALSLGTIIFLFLQIRKWREDYKDQQFRKLTVSACEKLLEDFGDETLSKIRNQLNEEALNEYAKSYSYPDPPEGGGAEPPTVAEENVREKPPLIDFALPYLSIPTKKAHSAKKTSTKTHRTKVGYATVICPQEMVKDEKAIITTQISQLKEYLTVTDGGEIKPISISEKMSCKLIAPECFWVVPAHTEQQCILPDKATHWEWWAVPSKRGHHTLKIVITRQVDLKKKGEAPYDELVSEQLIRVKVSPSKELKHWFGKNYQWLLGSIAGTGLGWKLFEFFHSK